LSQQGDDVTADNLAQAKRTWVRNVLGINLGSTEGASTGVVAYRTALLAFRAARDHVTAQTRALAQDIADTLPEEADLAERVADEIEVFCDTLSDTIDAGINSLADNRAESNAAVRNSVLALVDQLAANRLIAHVDRNPMRPLAIAQTLTAALKGVAHTVI
jgi:hypothetical protein